MPYTPRSMSHMAGPSLQGVLNADILVWARETNGFDLDTAAEKAKIAPERLEAWERGDSTPTLSQLRTLANLYKRSLAVFFLKSRPKDAARPADHRRFELSTTGRLTPELAASLREAQSKREGALDIFAQLEQTPPRFRIALDPAADAETAASAILTRVGITAKERAKWHDDYDALRVWKAAVEQCGVLVMQTSGVELSEMRGSSLALSPLPIILLNGSDAPLARIFTLLHELAHITRAESGLCDVLEEHQRPPAVQKIEGFCNHVAGAMLVPQADLLGMPAVANANRNTEWRNEQLQEFRTHFWASREVVLRRLLIAGKTSREFYAKKRDQFIQDYAGKESKAGMVPWYRKVVLKNGRFLTRLALNAYDSSVITGTELSRLLGTKLDHLPRIAKELGARDAA